MPSQSLCSLRDQITGALDSHAFNFFCSVSVHTLYITHHTCSQMPQLVKDDFELLPGSDLCESTVQLQQGVLCLLGEVGLILGIFYCILP